MTQNVRIITAATLASTVGAARYRDQAAVTALVGPDVDFNAMTQNAKASKPAFEIHERENSRRNYTLTLIRRNNANKTTEVGSIDVGFYGRRLNAQAA
jgi:hypothetical protein